MRKGVKFKRLFNSIAPKIHAFIMVILLLSIMALHKGKLVGYDVNVQYDKVSQPARFTLVDVKAIFEKATNYSYTNDSLLVFKGLDQIGWGYNTSPGSDSIVGFSSAVPMLIGYNLSNKLIGIKLLENAESPDFVEKIKETGFLKLWNNLNINDIIDFDVDGISGATETSHAIIKTLKHSTGKVLDQSVITTMNQNIWIQLKKVVGIILFILAILQFLLPKKFKKFRTIFQIIIVLILGFWLGIFLSAVSIFNWSVYGLDLSTKVLIASILIVSTLFPLVTGKAFYCTYLCPYGACQDLMGKLNKRKIQLPLNLKVFLSNLREKVFAVLIILLLTGVSFDLTNVEPFSAFLFQTASLPIIVLAILFALLSVFLPRPWCNYICPTGQLLEIIRKPIKR